ncbi:MAG: MarC family protein [Candidatus Altiarchaeota archaeon]
MDIQTFFIQSLVTLFLIVNPIGNVPAFISLLDKFSEDDKQQMIRRAVFIAMITLIIFTLIGNYIFQFLGISIYSFRIAGGILLLIISVEMLFGRRSRTETSNKLVELAEERENISITPLAIPLLTGPGAITTGIVFFSYADNIVKVAILLFNIIVIFLVAREILLRYKIVYKIFGNMGVKVVRRIMGLMLSAMAVQFIIEGISEAIKVISVF